MEGAGHVQPVLSLICSDRELFPHAVEPGQRVAGGARGAAQRLAQHHRGLQQLPAVIVRALRGKDRTLTAEKQHVIKPVRILKLQPITIKQITGGTQVN